MIGLNLLPDSLDAGQPVDWTHPLNDSLISWWLVSPLGHPAYRGGSTLRDLCGRYPGTLTGGPLWYGERGRRGGRGSIFFDGSDDYVDCGVVSQIASATNATLCGWMYKPTTGTRVGFGQHTSSYRFSIFWDSSGNTVYNQAENGSESYPSYTASPTTGWNHFVIAYDGSLSGTARTACYLNGVLQSLTTGGSDPAASLAATANQAEWRLGMDVNVGTPRYFGGQIDDVRLYSRTLAASEIRQLYELSQRGYVGLLNRRKAIAYSIGVTSSNQTVTPTTAALVLSTFAPTVQTPRLVTPTTASLAITTFAPRIGQGVIPTTAALTLATFAPTVLAPRLCTPTTLALSLTTFAPTVTAASGTTATPTTAALSLTAFAPVVLTPRVATPTTASLTTTAFAPTVQTPRNVVPATANLALTTFAPTVQTPRNVVPATASLTLNTFAPGVFAGQTVTPGAANLTLTTFAPTVINPQTVTPGVLNLLLTGYAPTVQTGGTGGGADESTKRRKRIRIEAIGDSEEDIAAITAILAGQICSSPV